MIAELAEEYSDAILHVTTRQDVQLDLRPHRRHAHPTRLWLPSDNPDYREACGTACATSPPARWPGVCHTEAFDYDALRRRASSASCSATPDWPGLGGEVQACVLWAARACAAAG